MVSIIFSILPIHTAEKQSVLFTLCHRNHVKKKKKYLLPHSNIIAMYHVFAAPVDVHDIAEAKELFPAALPRRIHSDGMGRNMTMFIVMDR